MNASDAGFDNPPADSPLSGRRGRSGASRSGGAPRSVEDWIRETARRLTAAEVCCSSGMQEPYLEAEYLVLHTFAIPLHTPANRRPPPPGDAAQRMRGMLDKRIRQRQPAAYVTKEAFFAGAVYYVDERVLIPRSRIENMIDDPKGFSPWLDDGRVRRILDLGTGSGCLAIALARRFPLARVDAVDLSPDALAVARVNRSRFKLQQRMRLIQSDLFAGLAGERYDLIVSNPPYVPQADFERLPPEYRREPALALRAGPDGLDLLEPILRQAPDFLTPGGLLVCETGDDVERILMDRWPEAPVAWVPFHFGASGVFAVLKEPLDAWRKDESGVHA
ncbi:MAG: 50S ribosomal protein L3 N(5)-glutamine methyltransferase [Magnetococcales bacterium]|nr:50S ribosomal protein L3 N(5)-glutamine methyltransferase [Magnetococcales bacterium]